jgi:hypothetical protein
MEAIVVVEMERKGHGSKQIREARAQWPSEELARQHGKR